MASDYFCKTFKDDDRAMGKILKDQLLHYLPKTFNVVDNAQILASMSSK